MKPARRGEVVTFYSYKGGVGRSAAVANVATLLAQRGHRVLAIDFDLEAPGLHRYFADGLEAIPAGTPPRRGTIDFFAEFRAALAAALPDWDDGDESATLDAGAEARVRELISNLLDKGGFIGALNVPDPNREGATCPLHLMQAGRFDASYPERVRTFPWQTFYEAHPFFVELLADELGKRFDYVLVDSRTGTTDVGNLCTVLLPEKLVLVFAPNEQSLHGAVEVGLQAIELRKASPDMRPLPLFPLISRVENAENDLQRRWIAVARQRFEQVFESGYGMRKSLSEYFDLVQIPHRSFYAYGETVAAMRERSLEVHSLAGAFRVFTDAVTCNNAIEAQSLIRQRWENASSALERPSLPGAAPAAPVSEPPPSDNAHSSGLAASTAPTPNPRGRTLAAITAVSVVAGLAVAAFIGYRSASGLETKAAAPGVTAEVASPTIDDPRVIIVPPIVTAPPDEATPAPPESVPDSAAKPVGSTPPAKGLPKPTSSPKPAGMPKPEPLPPELPSATRALLPSIKVRASSKVRPGERTSSGKDVFQFSVWIDAPANTVQQIKSVDYFFDHPSFVNNTFRSTTAPQFVQGYSGWGCITTVEATIHWKSGELSKIPFDQCAAL